MNEIGFRKLVILFVILGLLILIAQTFLFQPKEVLISEILYSNKQEVVFVNGIVNNLVIDSSYVSFNLCKYQRCIKCILFNPNNFLQEIIEVNNSNKQEIKVKGKIEIYRDELELIVYDVEKT